MTNILRKETSNHGTNIYFECDYCGKEAVTSQGAFRRSKNHYCSVECYAESKVKKKRRFEDINKLWFIWTTRPLCTAKI